MTKIVVTFDDNVNEFLLDEEGNMVAVDETVDEEVINVFKTMAAVADAAAAGEFSAKDTLDALEHARGNHKTMKISLEVV